MNKYKNKCVSIEIKMSPQKTADKYFNTGGLSQYSETADKHMNTDFTQDQPRSEQDRNYGSTGRNVNAWGERESQPYSGERPMEIKQGDENPSRDRGTKKVTTRRYHRKKERSSGNNLDDNRDYDSYGSGEEEASPERRGSFLSLQ